MYLIFAISAVLANGKSRKLIYIVFFGITCFQIFFFALCHIGLAKLSWIYSTWAFVFGVAYASNDKFRLTIYSFVCRLPLVIEITVMITLYVITMYVLSGLPGTIGSIAYILATWVCSLVFVCLLIRLKEQLQFKNVIPFMGIHSAEIILTQMLALSVFRNTYLFVDGDILWGLVSICMNFILVLATAPVFKAMLHIANR